MKVIKALLLVMVLGLAACTTGQVVPAGKDSYSLSVSRCGICEPAQGYATEQASAYCTSIGKNLVIRSINGNSVQPWAPGNATILFSCLNADDPDYQAPTLRKDNGVTTLQNR